MPKGKKLICMWEQQHRGEDLKWGFVFLGAFSQIKRVVDEVLPRRLEAIDLAIKSGDDSHLWAWPLDIKELQVRKQHDGKLLPFTYGSLTKALIPKGGAITYIAGPDGRHVWGLVACHENAVMLT